MANPLNGISSAINEIDRASGLLSGSEPQTSTRLSYGFTLHAAFGGRRPRVIGTLQDVKFSQGRQVDDEFEVEAHSNGFPIEMVPQALNKREVTFQRFDTYTTILEQIFGDGEFVTLIDTARPLLLREVWKDPSGFFSTTTRAYQYVDVKITDYDRQVNVGNRIVTTNISLRWKNRVRVL
jgi:hypothetical protein